MLIHDPDALMAQHISTQPAAPGAARPGSLATHAAAPVAGRWEWRWIGRELPMPRATLGLAGIDPPVTSTETYLLSARTPHNVKIRGAKIDVKRLRSVAADGLEQWSPTVQAASPVCAPDIQEVYAALDLRVPRVLPDAMAVDALLRRILADTPAVRRADIVKHRTRLATDGCAGEFVEFECRGERWTSLAFESENAEAVRAVLARLGLPSRANLNYPAALKRIVGPALPLHHISQGVR